MKQKRLPLLNVVRHKNVPPRMALLARIFGRRWIRHRGERIFGQVVDVFVVGHGDADARVGRVFATAPLQLCLPGGRGTASLVLFGRRCEQGLACGAGVAGPIGGRRRRRRRRRRARQLWRLVVVVAAVQRHVVVSVVAVLCGTVRFVDVVGLLFGVALFAGHGRFVGRIFVLWVGKPAVFAECAKSHKKCAVKVKRKLRRNHNNRRRHQK